MAESGEYTDSAILTKDFPSRPEALSDIRRTVESAAAHTRLPQESVEDFLTAVDEAAANAIRHGNPPTGPDAILRITCRYSADALEVQVRDFGTGFPVPETPTMPAPDAMGGRGLPLMVALADAVTIQASPEGTTVTLEKRAGSAA